MLIFSSETLNEISMRNESPGWNDVGWRNPDIQSPNIDKLAGEGVVLDQYYVQPVCTPSVQDKENKSR